MTDRDWYFLIAAVLGGGLAGAFFNHAIAWLRQPRVHLIFSSGVPGCLVNLPGYLQDNGKPVLDANNDPVSVPMRYLRIKIENRGRTVAQGVNVYVTKLNFWHQTAGTEEFDEGVMDLPLARLARLTFDLPPGGHRYMDVFSVWEHNGHHKFQFAFAARPDRIYLRPYGFGSYRAALTATSHNATAKHLPIDWHWDQQQGAAIPADQRTQWRPGTLRQWAAVIGLLLTAIGILVGFYLPTIAARWSGSETINPEFWLQIRFAIGVAFVLIGTGFQIYGAWAR